MRTVAATLSGMRSMLTANALQVYEFISALPAATVESVDEGLALRMRDAQEALDELMVLHLVQCVDDNYVSVSPEVALAGLVDAQERQILDLQREVAERRATMLPLVPKYLEARARVSDVSQFEIVEDATVAQQLLLDFGRRVNKEVLMVVPGRGSTVEMHEESDAKDLELLERGVIRKNLYHERRRDHAATRNSVARLTPAGAEFRTLPVVPWRLFMFDRHAAILSRGRESDDGAAIVTRDADLVRLLGALFDAVWEFADPFTVDDATTEQQLSATQRTILRGLASGLTDEALASRLGMSVRTCRRHIAQIFELLGADSRFQAGALAAAKGWL